MNERQKQLKQEYLNTRQPMGVYRILNTRNGKSLVGSSVNLDAIFNRHRLQLRTNSHRNKQLAADWKEFGEEAFEFEVLETLEPLDSPEYRPADDLRFLEEHWLEKLQPYGDNGYHSKPVARQTQS